MYSSHPGKYFRSLDNTIFTNVIMMEGAQKELRPEAVKHKSINNNITLAHT